MTKQDFLQLLVSHDWYFERTEDSAVYKRGAEHRRMIIEAKNSLGEEGEYLFNKYAKKFESGTNVAVEKPTQVQRKIVCRSSGKMGEVLDKTPNGYLEVSFDGEYGIKSVRQSDVIKLY